MSKKALIAIVLSGSVLIAVQSSQAATKYPNSPCGPDTMPPALRQFIPQEYHGANFRHACRNHDNCYETHGISKRECDRRFKNDLMRACECSDRPIRCRMVGRIMYRSTALFGGGAFRSSRK